MPEPNKRRSSRQELEEKQRFMARSGFKPKQKQKDKPPGRGPLELFFGKFLRDRP